MLQFPEWSSVGSPFIGILSKFPRDSYTRMSYRIWRENKQNLTWWPELVLLGCCLVSLYFRCDILAPRRSRYLPEWYYKNHVYHLTHLHSAGPVRLWHGPRSATATVCIAPGRRLQGREEPPLVKGAYNCQINYHSFYECRSFGVVSWFFF